MAVPAGAFAATQTWSSLGNLEPSNQLDDSNYMWFQPPGTCTDDGSYCAPKDGVYFNGFQATSAVVTTTGLNPNTAVTGSHVETFTFHPRAFLGVWTDCNADGYIGLAETAEEEYPSTVLTAQNNDGPSSACPAGTPHNHNGWVTEFLWIGPNPATSGGSQTNAQVNPRMIVDNTATVWADEGVPQLDNTHGSGFCWVNPPVGAAHTVGGLLDWQDCTDGYFIHKELTGDTSQYNPWEHDPTVAPVASIQTGGDDSASQSALTFDCSNQAPVWGASTGQQLNGVQDQANSANGGQVTGSPVGEHTAADGSTAIDFTTDGPHNNGVPTVNPSGDAAGTTNATVEYAAGDCNTHDDSGNDFYGAVGECQECAEGLGNARAQAYYTFTFSPAKRGSPNSAANGVWGNTPDPLNQMPNRLGLPSSRDIWGADETVSPPRDSGKMGRGATPEVAELEVHFMTFFAKTAIAGTPGHTDKYGNWPNACNGSIGAGVGGGHPINNWICDPTLWNLHVNGEPIKPANGQILPVVGDTYNLRDVDCWDQQLVGGVPVYAGGEQVGKHCDDPYDPNQN